jgi:hypothetical protein
MGFWVVTCMPPAAGGSEMLITITRLKFYNTKYEEISIFADRQTDRQLKNSS